MPEDMEDHPQRAQRSQRVNDILCVLSDPGGFSDQRKGVEIKTKDILTISS